MPIIQSKRFWATLASIAVVVLQGYVPLSPEQITTLVFIIGGWVIGDSIRPAMPK